MERVLSHMGIEDCDNALALLRDLAHEACLREIALLSIDDVLDRRLELATGLPAPLIPAWLPLEDDGA
jgi:hypothetical protein